MAVGTRAGCYEHAIRLALHLCTLKHHTTTVPGQYNVHQHTDTSNGPVPHRGPLADKQRAFHSTLPSAVPVGCAICARIMADVVKKEYALPHGPKLIVLKGSLTDWPDMQHRRPDVIKPMAVVNAANQRFQPGGGVDGCKWRQGPSGPTERATPWPKAGGILHPTAALELHVASAHTRRHMPAPLSPAHSDTRQGGAVAG